MAIDDTIPTGATARPISKTIADPALAALLALFLLMIVPAILLGIDTELAATDMLQGHIPQINFQIAHPFTLYNPATIAAQIPGYHMLMAWIAILFGYASIDEGSLLLRFVNAALGCGFLVIAWLILRRLAATSWQAAALALPLACSTYVISSAVWLTTDDGALLFYALTLYAVMFQRRNGALAAASTTLLVLWRHLFLPVAGIYALACLHAGRHATRRDFAAAAAAILPAALIVGYFVWLWGGFVPPKVQGFNTVTLQPSVPLHAVALTGLFALAYSPTLWRVALALERRSLLRVAAAASAAGALLWLVTASDYDDFPHQRWGSLVWYLARHTPVIAHHSPVVLVLTVLGAAALCVMLLHARARGYFPAAILMLLLYFVAYSAQYYAWQRYIEPPIMLAFAVFVAQAGRLRWLDLAGPLAMSVVFGCMSLLRLYGIVGQLFA